MTLESKGQSLLPRYWVIIAILMPPFIGPFQVELQPLPVRFVEQPRRLLLNSEYFAFMLHICG